MWDTPSRGRIRTAVAWIENVAAVLMLIYVAALRADPDGLGRRWPVVGGAADFLQNTALIAIPLLAVVVSAASFTVRKLGDPVARNALGVLVDEFREAVFREDGSDPQHYHRVTLFRYRKWVFRPYQRNGWKLPLLGKPWEGWLVPVMRSGHTTQKTTARFLAPDDADRATGVAGRTWAVQKPVIVDDLPSVAREADPSEDDYIDYASRSYVPVDLARYKRPEARSLVGFPIETAGEPWGVLVLDSRNPKMDVDAARKRFRAVAGVLGSLVGEA